MINALARKSLFFHLILLKLGHNTLPFGLEDQVEVNDIPKSSERDKKILIVGMSQSPHLHSWIAGLAESRIVSEVWLFPSDLPTRTFKNAKIEVKNFPHRNFGQITKFYFKVLDILTSRLWRSYFLCRELNRVKPTHLHFHETQHGAYIYNPIAKHPKNKFFGKIILSTWGSDLVHYGRIESHSIPIKQVLSWTDLLTAERNVDLQVANEYGFKGKFLAPVYITVGSKDLITTLRQPSERTLVLIKGYEDTHGRALNALSSLQLAASQMDLTKFEFKVFSASKSVANMVKTMKKVTKLDIAVLPKMPKLELMEFYREARTYLGLAISDGLSTSMVEAMSNGVFPIQSVNSSAPEFLINGVTGGVVDPYDINGIAAQLMESLRNDELVDQAAISNFQTIRAKYNWDMGIQKIVELYD